MLVRTLSVTTARRLCSAAVLLSAVACKGEGGNAGSAASATPSAGAISPERLRQADAEPGQWMSLGRTSKGERFSPLTTISDTNAAKLGFAWEYTARTRRGRVEHGQEATPIVVDGVLYASGPWGAVYAVDAKTGAEKWRYDPEADGRYNRRACCDVVSRGLQVWRGRVYVATIDGYLVALDAASGKQLWRSDTFIDRETRFYSITGAPQVAGDVVVIGNSGGEFGVRGYITAYDLQSGAQKWRFFTVPGDPAKGAPEDKAMEAALKTWGPKTDWASGLGGTVWGEMTYDPELNLLYVGTGNSTPYAGWHRDPSRGDNLYLVSILAIDPSNGALKWHYQQVPWELWDYTASANMILADLTIEGRPRKVLMQAPKNGIYYVLDRETGAFISGKPFVFANWLTGFDSAGRPAINPAAVYEKGPALVFPTQAGGHNWQPMAYSPKTGLTYIPAREQGMLMFGEPTYKWTKGKANMGAGAMLGFTLDQVGPAERKLVEDARRKDPKLPLPATQEVLIAWDPIAQQEKWRVPLGDKDWAGGGVLTTAGNLVIQGKSDGHLVVYRADNGTKLHDIEVGTAIMAAPISYEIDGEQYIAVLAGFGGALAPMYPLGSAPYTYQNYGRILAFKLGGGATPLPPKRQVLATPEPPTLAFYSDSLADRGGALFGTSCAFCHLARGDAQLSAYPDLHRLTPQVHAAFDSIVTGGTLQSSGMSSFADVFSPGDVQAIHAYVLREQRELWEEERKKSGAAPASPPDKPVGTGRPR
ncbi:MAG: PQQ-dependent dehydrogenase, methanol/ethanol family [Gemmatimonadetes bacterium]|nr:PQQ-dependent dehydrogenase, methanol/ethanol family [Gemmatimonadota bacterium]